MKAVQITSGTGKMTEPVSAAAQVLGRKGGAASADTGKGWPRCTRDNPHLDPHAPAVSGGGFLSTRQVSNLHPLTLRQHATISGIHSRLRHGWINRLFASQAAHLPSCASTRHADAQQTNSVPRAPSIDE